MLFISAEIEEVLRLSHKVAVLRDRQIVAELANERRHGRARCCTRSRAGRPHDEASPDLAAALDRRAPDVTNLFISPGFFSIDMRGGHLYGSLIDILSFGAPLDARRARHDARHRDRGHRSLGRRRRGDLRRLRLPADQQGAGSEQPQARCSWPSPQPSALSMLCGLWNGVLVAVIGIQPFVATLILMVAGRGIAQLITTGQIITITSSPYKKIGAGYLFALPFSIFIVAGVFIVTALADEANGPRHADRGRRRQQGSEPAGRGSLERADHPRVRVLRALRRHRGADDQLDRVGRGREQRGSLDRVRRHPRRRDRRHRARGRVASSWPARSSAPF